MLGPILVFLLVLFPLFVPAAISGYHTVAKTEAKQAATRTPLRRAAGRAA
ncbi:hypothetical protein ABQE69_04970 [Mycolicibacillus trivialis]|nr:hypothetical protein [Mycolicibacillus trivialis]